MRLSVCGDGSGSFRRRAARHQHSAPAGGLLRQAVYGRLPGYEDVNDAGRLAHDPAMRAIVGREGMDRSAVSTSQRGRFETEWLATEADLAALADRRPRHKGGKAQGLLCPGVSATGVERPRKAGIAAAAAVRDSRRRRSWRVTSLGGDRLRGLRPLPVRDVVAGDLGTSDGCTIFHKGGRGRREALTSFWAQMI
jgi:Transposase DDE domain group 1